MDGSKHPAPSPFISQEPARSSRGLPSMDPAVGAQGLPVGSAASIEFTFIPSSSGEPQVEHAAATQCSSVMERAVQALQADFLGMLKERREIIVDMGMMEMKMHRYPASIRALGERFTSPVAVAIGPYHHHQGRDDLKAMEKAKHLAAYHCINSLGRSSVQEMSRAVCSVAEDARRLYDKDMVAGVGDDEFLLMMFYDACFLVQFMLAVTHSMADTDSSSLRRFIHSKGSEIWHDIMLFENQLPWLVVETVMRFVPVNLVGFVDYFRRGFHDCKPPKEKTLALDDSYKPPHLLGLLRFYLVGRYYKTVDLPKLESYSTVSTNELSEIGITLAANKTDDLKDMGIGKKGPFFANLYLAPLSLDATRPSCLVNMAAHELCATSNFQDAGDEDSAVCSYLQLIAMLVRREEDVHVLRTKRVLKGVAFTDKQAFDFFSGLHDLRLGSLYVRATVQIEDYRLERRVRTKVHAFVYRNGKTIVTAFSIIAVIVGILKALQPLIIKAS